MKTTGTIGVPTKRHLPVVPLMVAAGILLTAAGAGVLVHDLGTGDGGTSEPVRLQSAASVSEDWELVLRADTAQVLRHRPGLTAVDFISSHAFGWDGLTLHEVVHNPFLRRELRLQRTWTPIDLVRSEARGS